MPRHRPLLAAPVFLSLFSSRRPTCCRPALPGFPPSVLSRRPGLALQRRTRGRRKSSEPVRAKVECTRRRAAGCTGAVPGTRTVAVEFARRGCVLDPAGIGSRGVSCVRRRRRRPAGCGIRLRSATRRSACWRGPRPSRPSKGHRDRMRECDPRWRVRARHRIRVPWRACNERAGDHDLTLRVFRPDRIRPSGRMRIAVLSQSGGSNHGGWSHVIQSLENPVRFSNCRTWL